MLRRLLLIFSLVVSFGLGQIGAVTHEISHYADASTQSQYQNSPNNAQSNDQKSADKNSSNTHGHTCEKCVSYAELGGAIASSHIVLFLTDAKNLASSSLLKSVTATKLHPYSARAPPSLV